MKSATCRCVVEVSPEEVDAGAAITLRVRVESPHVLRSAAVCVRDHEDAELARTALAKSGDGIYEASEIVVAAPCAVGEHVYRAVVVSADGRGVAQELASTDVRLAVKPHAAELNVWDVPSTTVAGERFRIAVGLRCSAGCALGGQELSLFDHEGAHAGTVTLGREVWPGTESLYFAKAEARAPLEAGSHPWEVRISEWASKLPHAGGSLPVVVRVVGAPDCEVTVKVLDRKKRAPIRGARVVMHPYRALTGEDGIAKVKVTRGRYEILVSASKYIQAGTELEVTADTTTTAELDDDPPWQSPDEMLELPGEEELEPEGGNR